MKALMNGEQILVIILMMIQNNEDVDYYTARPDKLFKSEEAAIRACEKYCDANPSDYCEVLHYHVDSGWQVSEAYDGFYI